MIKPKKKDVLTQSLWRARSVDETKAIYADWAQTYDVDVLASGYVTPQRVANVVATMVGLNEAVLDFGCGTGLSGLALASRGFTTIDGTDISPEMLAYAIPRGCYRDLRLGSAGTYAFPKGTHQAVVATGVISAGAAPPETLTHIVDNLPTNGILVFSFNDPTLEIGTYDDVLDQLITEKIAAVVFREHGPHLPEKGMGSDVIAIRKT